MASGSIIREVKWGVWEQTKYYHWLEYMQSDKHPQQDIIVTNKIKAFLIVRVTMKYDMRQWSMASGSKIWDVKEEKRKNKILLVQ